MMTTRSSIALTSGCSQADHIDSPSTRATRVLRPSTASMPAAWLRVAYQSARCIKRADEWPRSCGGNQPPARAAGTRTPPSNEPPLPPRSGLFDPCWLRAPPLSDVTTSSVLSYIPRMRSASIRDASVSSIERAIASSSRRRDGTHVARWESTGSVGLGEIGLRGVGLGSPAQSNHAHDWKYADDAPPGPRSASTRWSRSSVACNGR